MTTPTLTFAGVGLEEAEAQLGMAKAMLDDLVVGFRERLDGERDLADRVREIHEVLATAVRVAAMDPTRSADRGVGDADRFSLAHGDSPSVGADDPTVGAPGATRQPVAPGTPPAAWMGARSLAPGYRLHLAAPAHRGSRAACGKSAPLGGWTVHDDVVLDRNPMCRACLATT